jgi:hypothetical protein
MHLVEVAGALADVVPTLHHARRIGDGAARADLVKDFKSLTGAPSRLISEIGPTGRDFFGPGAHDAESADLGLPHLGTAAMSVSY